MRHESPAAPRPVCAPRSATLRALLDAIDDDMWNGPSGVPDLTLGEGVLTLWYDTYVHADDIRAAVGQESDRGAGLDATIAYLAAQLTADGWGPATLALDGVGRHEVGGGGPEITGDAAAVRARGDRPCRRLDHGARTERQHLLIAGHLAYRPLEPIDDGCRRGPG